MRMRRNHPLAKAAIAFLLTVAPAPATAQGAQADLSQMSLEELMALKVTSVGKKEEALRTAPAAVHVITQEDIRRSGMTTLPEVLRLAPGVEVAQVASGIWAVSIRGDNSLFANKLLVLVDGRSVYAPSFSGVFWNEQDIPLDDIERIEIIRGPGATLWGANAVNGVINIITFPAAETQGALLDVAGGSYQPVNGYARYGGKLGKNGQYRMYVHHARRGNLPRQQTSDGNDGWNATRAGFRSDWQLAPADSLTVQGEVMRAIPDLQTGLPAAEAPYPGFAAHRGGNLLARWSHRFRPQSVMTLQTYVDEARQTYPGMIRAAHTTVDVDLQHNLTLGRHELVWGGGIRVIRQRSWGTAALRLDEPMQTRYLESGFAQDEIALGRARLTLGSKFEANSFSGVEIQPTVRLLVQASERVVGWAAISRAARTPNESEAEAQYSISGPGPGGIPISVKILHIPHPRSEHMLAYETGFRFDPTRRLKLDLSGYYNVYQHLVTLRPFFPMDPSRPTMALSNGGSGRSYGWEATATWIPAGRWTVSGSYSWLRSFVNDRFGVPFFSVPGYNPRHLFQLHGSAALPAGLEADAGLYFTSKLPAQAVAAIARLDLRLGWRPRESWELSLTGQNLAQDAHAEFFFRAIQPAPMLIPRRVLARVIYRF